MLENKKKKFRIAIFGGVLHIIVYMVVVLYFSWWWKNEHIYLENLRATTRLIL
jgi:hypothetical protein